MAYACDTHPDRSATVLITNLDTGDVAALCAPECLEAWSAALAHSFAAQRDALEADAEAVARKRAQHAEDTEPAGSPDVPAPSDDLGPSDLDERLTEQSEAATVASD